MTKKWNKEDRFEISLGTEQELDALSDQLFSFNANIVPGFLGRETPSESIRYVVKKENKVIAGLVGKIIINNVVYIDDLFVNERYRKQGCASLLLQRIEVEAKSRGCYLAYLDTINVDAVTFYEKRGYQIFATLENVPCPGVNAVYLKKNL